MTTPTPSMPTLDKVVQAFMAIKSHRTALRHQWEAEDLLLEADQNKLKALMLQIMNTTGAESIRTEHGTAIRTLKTKASASDWTALYAWIVADPDRFEVLEKRVKPTFVKQYMNENADQLPPGISVYEEYEISVRSPTSAPSSKP